MLRHRKMCFYHHFSKKPSLKLNEALKEHFNNTNLHEIQVLLSIFQQTSELTYIKELLQRNPAHLQDVNI